ncbi:hypothetical protein [Methanogenium cariaci]|jgi:dTDP-4-amino-4,6-dideoxygalactose transaminase
MIPVGKPSVGDEEIAAVSDVIRSGMLAQGAVAAFWNLSVISSHSRGLHKS